MKEESGDLFITDGVCFDMGCESTEGLPEVKEPKYKVLCLSTLYLTSCSVSFDVTFNLFLEFLFNNIKNSKFIEIEAKFGRFISKSNNSVISLPVMSESVLSPSYKMFRFESNLSNPNFEKLHRFIDARSKDSNIHVEPNSGRIVDKYILEQGSRIRLQYKVDDPRSIENILPISCVKKERVSDFHISCPYSQFDVRISINTESPVDVKNIDPTKLKLNSSDIDDMRSIRIKNRKSYKFKDLLQLDLTRLERIDRYTGKFITLSDDPNEFEIEALFSDILVSEKFKGGNNQIQNPSFLFRKHSYMYLMNIRKFVTMFGK